jgi:hypothetical protein
VNNSIFIRDGVANQVFWIYPSHNENNLKIRNEHRLKKIIFDENFNSKLIADKKFNLLSFNPSIDDSKDNPIKIMCKKIRISLI